MDIEKNSQLSVRATTLPTLKQLERSIYQQFSTLYRSKTGASPQRATCSIFKNYLVIVAEEALSPLETTIKNSGEIELLREMRFSIEQVLESELKHLIQKLANVQITDLICSLNINSGRVITTVILHESPQVRIKKKVQV